MRAERLAKYTQPVTFVYRKASHSRSSCRAFVFITPHYKLRGFSADFSRQTCCSEIEIYVVAARRPYASRNSSRLFRLSPPLNAAPSTDSTPSAWNSKPRGISRASRSAYEIPRNSRCPLIDVEKKLAVKSSQREIIEDPRGRLSRDRCSRRGPPLFGENLFSS